MIFPRFSGHKNRAKMSVNSNRPVFGEGYQWTKMKRVSILLDRLPRFKSILRSIYRRIYYFSKGEPAITHCILQKETLRELVGKPNPLVLEIGSNDCETTLWFLQAFEKPIIHCFEPDPRAIARAKKNIQTVSEIHLHEFALSNEDGESVFYMSDGRRDQMSDGWDQSGSLKKPKNHLSFYPWCAFENVLTVKTARLDTWCKENEITSIDFIWMDVQGAELDVIRGGVNALSRTRLLYTEYNNNELYEGQPKLKKLLKEMNKFRVLFRYDQDVLLKNIQYRDN